MPEQLMIGFALQGRPTYVAIWKVKDKENKIVEVKYAGTHENADYERIC